jgi:hypothetical protein
VLPNPIALGEITPFARVLAGRHHALNLFDGQRRLLVFFSP